MMLRIGMDAKYGPFQMRMANLISPEWCHKKPTTSMIHLVKSLRIGIEEMSEFR